MPRLHPPTGFVLLFLALLSGSVPAARADALLLQQAVPADQAGNVFLLIERARLVLARVRKEKGREHALELTLAGEPTVTVTLRCVDQAAARQVLDALRAPPGVPLLDVTARCRW
jgi:hypothetical protein